MPTYSVAPSSEGTGLICRVPSTRLSQSLSLLNPSTCVGFEYGFVTGLFPGKWATPFSSPTEKGVVLSSSLPVNPSLAAFATLLRDRLSSVVWLDHLVYPFVENLGLTATMCVHCFMLLMSVFALPIPPALLTRDVQGYRTFCYHPLWICQFGRWFESHIFEAPNILV